MIMMKGRLNIRMGVVSRTAILKPTVKPVAAAAVVPFSSTSSLALWKPWEEAQGSAKSTRVGAGRIMGQDQATDPQGYMILLLKVG